MTIGENRNKERCKNWQIYGVWKLRFVTTERWNSRRTAFALHIRVSVSFFGLPSFINITQRYLHLSICCSALLLSCGMQWRRFWDRRNISVLLAIIFIPLGRTQLKIDLVHSEDPVEQARSHEGIRRQCSPQFFVSSQILLCPERMTSYSLLQTY